MKLKSRFRKNALEQKASAVNAQVQSGEDNERTRQDAIDEVQRIKSDAEEQIQIEREELAKEAAAVKQQLQDIEEEKRKQQDASRLP